MLQDGKTLKRKCGLKSEEKECDDSDRDGSDFDNGTCGCTEDLCNAAARPGVATATALMFFAAVAKYILA